MNGRPLKVTVEEAKTLTGYGFTPREVADALGIQIESVGAALKRAGQLELAAMFLEAAAVEREKIREAA